MTPQDGRTDGNVGRAANAITAATADAAAVPTRRAAP